MTISIGKDYNKTSISNYLVGLYYYVLDKEKMSTNGGANTDIFSYVPTIQSISFNPFIEMTDTYFNVTECEFDKEHFGVPNTNKSPKVYRINAYSSSPKNLLNYDLRNDVNINDKTIETIMLAFPFKYYMLCDYLNPPMIIKPQNITPFNWNLEISVMYSLSQTSKYNLFVKRYKNDKIGNVEGMINNNPLLFPVSSSAYAQFLATSGQTFAQGNTNALLENDMSLRQGTNSLNLDLSKNIANGTLGAISNILNLQLGNVVKEGVNSYFGYKENQLSKKNLNERSAFKEYDIESMALARKTDLLNTPRTMKTCGNDSIFNLDNANNKIDLIEFTPKVEQQIRLNRFFFRYGYKVNRYGIPNLKTRQVFNFIKMTKCDIDTSKIVYNDIEELQQIFESGITLWHVEDGYKMKEYPIENNERS